MRDVLTEVECIPSTSYVSVSNVNACNVPEVVCEMFAEFHSRQRGGGTEGSEEPAHVSFQRSGRSNLVDYSWN